MSSDPSLSEIDTDIIAKFADGAEMIPRLAWLQMAAKNKVPVQDSERTQERHESCILKINHLISSSARPQCAGLTSASKGCEGLSVEEEYLAEAVVRLLALCRTRKVDIIPAVVNNLTQGIVK